LIKFLGNVLFFFFFFWGRIWGLLMVVSVAILACALNTCGLGYMREKEKQGT